MKLPFSRFDFFSRKFFIQVDSLLSCLQILLIWYSVSEYDLFPNVIKANKIKDKCKANFIDFSKEISNSFLLNNLTL